MNVGLKVIDN